MSKNNFFIDIDSILDTRFSVLYALNQNKAIELITNGEYGKRKKDVFDNISSDIFLPMYRKRTKYMLSVATMTKSIKLVTEFLIESVSEIKNIENGLHSYLYINTYPYNLNKTEQDNISKLLLNILPTFVEIKYVDMSFEELTPEWLSGNVNNIMLYNGLEWIEFHTSNNNLLRRPLIDTYLYIPTIANGSTKSKDINNNFFNTLSNSLGGLITLVPIDISYFCTSLTKK